MEQCTESKLNGNIIKIFDLEEVEKHGSADDCWVIYGKGVYDVTTFLEKHPGGADLILREAGNNITGVLRDENIHTHTTNAYNILKEYKIGEVNGEINQDNSDDQLDISANELVGFKEELVDWDRGMVLQVHKFGHEYIKWVHSPVNRKIKMFDNNFVEFFSNTWWYIIPVVWLPVVVISAVIGYHELASKMLTSQDNNTQFINFNALLALSLYFFAGIFIWTLLEYILHRYIFHLEPSGDSPIQITFHFFFHGLHHKVPFDEGRLVFPPVMAAVFAAIFWYSLSVNLVDGVRTAVFSGGIAGYICYDMIHYYIHHGNPTKGSYLHDMRSHHVRHHFEDPTKGFGISTKFWDIIFDSGKRKTM